MKHTNKVIKDLHSLFLVQFTSGDYELTMLVMMAFMEHNGIKFNDCYKEETFFEELNSTHYNNEYHFEQLCKECLDMDVVQRKENEKIYGVSFIVSQPNA